MPILCDHGRHRSVAVAGILTAAANSLASAGTEGHTNMENEPTNMDEEEVSEEEVD